jgi:arginyl-tRNA--protein-N-Asp/Glu arginylyltransferase
MQQFNIKIDTDLEESYQSGLLPQRNDKNLFYFESSSRSDLSKFKLSSENRRILNKTNNFTFEKIPLIGFVYTKELQKILTLWIKELGWDFPTSSIKNIFTNHIFNYVYIWKNENNEIVAYAVCLITKEISHIAYVFYCPDFNQSNLPIRLVLQVVINSFELNLKYCYLGRFSETTGFYKRNMPGFQYFVNRQWIEYNISR